MITTSRSATDSKLDSGEGAEMLTTRLTEKLGIRHPIVQAPIGSLARAELVAAVCNAGGLGMLAMPFQTPDFVRAQIRLTRTMTTQPFGVNFLLSVATPQGLDAQLAVCIEERVPVASFFWGAAAAFVPRCHAAGIAVMHQVGTTDEARQAVDGGVDLVIAQGVEAGGHVRGTIGLLPLLISIINAVPDTPVIAAGGIVDGRGLAAVLAAGADAASIGTRFVATNESEAHPDYKKRLMSAREVDTVHTELHHIGWPPHSPVRVLRSALTDGTEKPEDSIGRMRRGNEILDVKPFSVVMPTIHVEGRTDLMANYAGQGVGLIEDILPAATVVERIASQAERMMKTRLRDIVH